MTPLRRFLVFQTLLAWQGGFFFYSAAVVPIGSGLLGPATQGSVTSRVTEVLNALGVGGLAVLAWELAACRDPSRRRTALRWWCWAAALASQYVLLVVHQLLVYFMDPTRTYVVIRPPFYPVHELYLWACTVQWVALLAFCWWTVRAWAAEEAGRGCEPPGGRVP